MKWFLIGLISFTNILWAAPPDIHQIIYIHRNDLGIQSSNNSYNDNLSDLSRKINQYHNRHHVRLSKLTRYASVLYETAITLSDANSIQIAIDELERMTQLALETPDCNPDARKWADKQLNLMKKRQSFFQLREQIPPMDMELLKTKMTQASNNDEKLTIHREMKEACNTVEKMRGYFTDNTSIKLFNDLFIERRDFLRYTNDEIGIHRKSVVEFANSIRTAAKNRRLLNPDLSPPPRPVSPPLDPSFPEAVFLPSLSRIVWLAKTIHQIGQERIGYFQTLNLLKREYPSIKTPHETAEQSFTFDALQARRQVEEGALLYKLGTRNKSFTGEDSQYWSLENPITTPNYTERYGLYRQNYENANFIERATMRRGADFITRESPPPPPDPSTGFTPKGGGMEIVVEPFQVKIEGHHSL